MDLNIMKNGGLKGQNFRLCSCWLACTISIFCVLLYGQDSFSYIRSRFQTHMSSYSPDFDLHNWENRRSVRFAITSGDISTTIHYVSNKSEANIQIGVLGTPLHYAIVSPNQNITEYLINIGADPNIENYYGKTPFIQCIKDNKISTFRNLIQKNDIEVPNNEFYHPLLFCLSNNRTEIATLICEHNPELLHTIIDGVSLNEIAREYDNEASQAILNCFAE